MLFYSPSQKSTGMSVGIHLYLTDIHHYRKVQHMALTKADIIETTQSEIGIPRHQSSDLVESLLELIKSTLASGEGVLVSGFGKFCIIEKRERKGRNPATGEDLMLAPRKVVTFKCSGLLREKINGY